MRIRPSLLLLLALIVSPLAARATTAQSYCQYVCVDESCRLEQSMDIPCGDATPSFLQVADDPDAAACLAEPVTMDMVSDSSIPYTTTNASKVATSPADQPAPTQPAPTQPAPTQPAPTQPPTTQPGTTPTAPAPAPAPPKKDVILTGFCDFDGTENPTKRILPDLEKAVRDKCGADINLKTQCLKVELPAIRDCKVEKKIVISLGVDLTPGMSDFRLETAAVNCFVDYDGNVKCKPVCIDPAKPIDNTVKAPGPWPTLPADPKIGGYPIIKGKPGQAGDYVCNGTFYWLCTQKECKPYFIHTPNFPKEKDKDVVPGLADLICKIIAANKAPAAKFLSFSRTR